MKLSDLITENDGATMCPTRVVSLAGALVFFGLAAYDAVQNGTADLIGFAQAFSLVIVAVAGGVSAKSAVEKMKDGTK